MKRALAGVIVAAAACRNPIADHAGSGPYELVIYDDSPGLDAATLDRTFVASVERSLRGLDPAPRLYGRAEDGHATVVVVPASDVSEDQLTLAVMANGMSGEDMPPRLPDDELGVYTQQLPEARAWFARGATGSGDPAVAIWKLDGVRVVDECGPDLGLARFEVDPEKVHALGVEIDHVRHAIEDDLAAASLAATSIGPAKLGDVATFRHATLPACVAAGADGAVGAIGAIARVRGYAFDRAEVARAAAAAGFRPLDAAHVYASRVRWDAAGPAVVAAASELAAAAGSADGVAWAVTQAEPDSGTARLLIGVRDGVPAERAVAAARHAASSNRAPATFDVLGGAIELEAVLPAHGAPEALDAAALAAVARLHAAGVAAGCDGCGEHARPALRYAIDEAAVTKLGASKPVVQRVVDALAPDGVPLGDRRRGADTLRFTVTGDPTRRLEQLEVRGRMYQPNVPLSAFVQMRASLARTYLRENGVQVATVWARAASEAEARTALAAVVPAGTVIRPRRDVETGAGRH